MLVTRSSGRMGGVYYANYI